MNAVARGTMWAEDGPVFSFRALNPSAQSAWIFTPYDGYTHALAQLTSNIIWALVPVEKIAVAFSLAACLITGVVAALVFLLTKRWGIHPVGRLLLAATTVCIPNATFEVLGNLANAHWYLLWLSPFIFLFRPRSRTSSFLAASAVFIIVTSEVQSVTFAPLLFAGLRDRKKWPLVAALGAGSCIQLTALLQGSRTRGVAPDWLAVIDGYFLHAPLTGLTGVGQASSAVVAYSGWEAAYLSILPFIFCAVWFAWGSRQRATLVAGLFGISLVLWVAGFAINYRDVFDYSAYDFGQLAGGVAHLRYAIVPTMLLFAFVALAVGRALTEPRMRAAGLAVTMLCVAVFAAGFHVVDGGVRANGPTWAAGISQARVTCADPTMLQFDLPIAPEPWSLTLPCQVLRTAGR